MVGELLTGWSILGYGMLAVLVWYMGLGNSCTRE